MQIDSIDGRETIPLTFFANNFGCTGAAHFWRDLNGLRERPYLRAP
jgi:hypothetical protein